MSIARIQALRDLVVAQLSTGGPLLLGTIAGGVLAYMSVALSARLLGASEFGLLGALLGVVSLIGVAVRPGYLAATHLAAIASTRGDVRVLRGLVTFTLLLAAGLGTLLLIATWLLLPQIEEFFRTTEASPLIVLALILAGTVTAQLLIGLVSGLHRFTTVAVVTVTEPLVRVVFVAPLIVALGVSGSLLSYLAGLAITCGIALRSIGGPGRVVPSVAIVRGALRVASASLVLTIAASLVQNLDLVLLRSYAPTTEVGLYAAAATLGGVLFMLCAPLYLPAFPRTVASHARGDPTWPILRDVLLLIVPICIMAILMSVWLGRFIGELLFGPGFEGVGAYLPAYVSKVAALVILATIGQHALAVGAARVSYFAAAVAVIGPVVVWLLRPSPLSTAVIMLSAAACAAGSISVLLWIGARRMVR